MARRTLGKLTLSLVLLCTVSACGAIRNYNANAEPTPVDGSIKTRNNDIETDPDNTIWSIFNRKTAEQDVSVNRYLWAASLEVLNFLPVQSVDPFTGVIVTGYGTPPGGARAYRATVLIDDPALDARSLNVALQTRGGRAVGKATSRAVEDAILSRARELRIADNKF